MRLEVVDELVEIVDSCHYFASKYLPQFLNCWKNIIVGRLKEFAYKNMWSSWIQCHMSPTMVAKDCKLLNFCLIVSTAAHLSIKFEPSNRCAFYATTTGKIWLTWRLLTPCSGRVIRYGLKTLLCIFWNSSGVLHDRVSEMVTHYAKYHKLTKVGMSNCSHYDKPSENYGPLGLEEILVSRLQIKEKSTFLH